MPPPQQFCSVVSNTPPEEHHWAAQATTNGSVGVQQTGIPELWAHQKEAVKRMASLADTHGGAVLDMGMGAGKTRTLLELVRLASEAELAERPDRPTRSLVIAPNSALSVWERENTDFLQGSHSFIRRQGSTSLSRFADTLADDLRTANNVLVAITYDHLRNDKLLSVLAGQRWAAIICDESHKLLNSKPLPDGSKISHIAGSTPWDARMRFAASGTTHPRSLLELHGQLRFVAPGWIPMGWNNFVSKYGSISTAKYRKKDSVVLSSRRDGMLRLASPTQELKTLLSGSSAPIHIAPPVAELIDLPSLVHIPIDCEMSKEARDVYDSLDERGEAQLPNGQRVVCRGSGSHDWTVQALQQVSSGNIEDWRPKQSAKLEALEDLVKGLPLDERVVVFCHWRHDHEAVRNKFKNQVETVVGGMTVEQRTEAIRRWEAGGPQILTFSVSIAEGVSLTAARHAVFLSTPWQPHAFAQAQARLHRTGQTRKVLVAVLLSTNAGNKTVDHAQYNLLMKHIGQAQKDNRMLSASEVQPTLAEAAVA